MRSANTVNVIRARERERKKIYYFGKINLLHLEIFSWDYGTPFVHCTSFVGKINLIYVYAGAHDAVKKITEEESKRQRIGKQYTSCTGTPICILPPSLAISFHLTWNENTLKITLSRAREMYFAARTGINFIYVGHIEYESNINKTHRDSN